MKPLDTKFWNAVKRLTEAHERGEIGGVDLRRQIRGAGQKYGLSAADLIERGILEKINEDTQAKPGSLKGAKRA